MAGAASATSKGEAGRGVKGREGEGTVLGAGRPGQGTEVEGAGPGWGGGRE